MKKEPINKDAFGYVKLHVYMPISENEFIAIEKYVAEMHNSFYRNDIYGNGDLKRFVYRNLTEENIFIEQTKVDAIVNALYDYMFEKGNLLSIDWVGKFDKWCDWKQTLSEAISEFILLHEYVPNIIIASEYTRSQIQFISEMTAGADYEDIKKLLKFKIDNSLPNKRFILLYSLDDGDGDDKSDVPDIKDPIIGEKLIAHLIR